MPSPLCSAADCRAAVDAVNRLLREGRLRMEDLTERLSEADLTLLQQTPTGDHPIPRASVDRLRAIAAEAMQEGAPARIVLSRHGTVAHEILHIRVLMIAFDAHDRLTLCQLMEDSQDIDFDVVHAGAIGDIPDQLDSAPFDVAIANLSAAQGPGMEALARRELRELECPLIPLIRRRDEPQALHLGDRSYLVREQLSSRWLLRAIRSAVEQNRLLSEVEIARDREHFHATRDNMTGLPNREYFRNQLALRLERAEARGLQVAVLFLDLDRFKLINDTLGHQAGDSLLITMSIRLSSALRRSDLVARVGGDEFLMMLVGDSDGLAPGRVAEKVLKSLDTPFLLEGREHSVTGSIGIASFPRDGHDPDELIRKADSAMYQAKSMGRNRFRFYSQSDDAVERRSLTLESKLRRVLEYDALELHFQPRIEARSGRILGAEALLRWTDPELGTVPPDEFIPVAEESGLIVAIGDWTIRRACALLKTWREAGHDLRVSVNISARQLSDASLRDSIIQSLWEYETPPERLELEITESALIRNHEVAAQVLQDLSATGVRLSLDDFGTGFSSLSYLRRFPVDLLKIDQSFVRDVVEDPDDAAITEAIISIAQKLRLRVVAEGVETREQFEFLRRSGCHEVQGYLFSPPVPPDAFEAILRNSPVFE